MSFEGDVTPAAAEAQEHFNLLNAEALTWVTDQIAAERTPASAVERFIHQVRGSCARTDEDAIRGWETARPGHLPLRALRDALGLGRDGLRLLLVLGLAEDNSDFGDVCAALQGDGLRHPSVGMLCECWPPGAFDVRAALRRLTPMGLVEFRAGDQAFSCRAPRVPLPLWEVMRGDLDAANGAGLSLTPLPELPALDALALSPDERADAVAAARALAAGALRGVVVRGHQGNGRGTLLGALARAAGRSALRFDASAVRPDDARWRHVGALATMLHAMPVFRVEAGPGERLTLPPMPAYDGPVGVAMGAEGAVEGVALAPALQLTRALPPPATRRALWSRLAGDEDAAVVGAAGRYRLTSGAIHRLAGGAKAHAAVRGAEAVTADDVRAAYRQLPRESLDLLAVRMAPAGDWSSLGLTSEALQELRLLELRCRRREDLAARGDGVPGGARNAGVRALLLGPSGTGKTLAARVLAARLGRTLYRVDLASVVNKYIGETEKNLHRVFSHAEATDVVLLLDEGDALMGRRTAVQGANDRYANLETNYLLQRLESFEGVLVVTTNAAEHIDPAFQRRMDAVIEFRAPEFEERRVLWALHLPAGHEVDGDFLREVASRCTLSGGQIRNIALHAALLALDEGAAMRTAHLEAAVYREYRKARSGCPIARRKD